MKSHFPSYARLLAALSPYNGGSLDYKSNASPPYRTAWKQPSSSFVEKGISRLSFSQSQAYGTTGGTNISWIEG